MNAAACVIAPRTRRSAGGPRGPYTPAVEAVWALAVAAVAFAAGAATGLIRERRHRAAAGSLVRQAEGAEARARARADEVRDMETAMSSMQEGVVLFGADGAATYANPAVATHLGVAPKALDALVPLELR